MKNNLWIAASLIFLGVALRLLPHQPNFVPITAIVLFASAHFSKKLASVVVLTTMLISDFFIGFHDTILWVYGSYLLIAIMGTLLKKKTTFTNTALVTTLSSYLFYLTTNFGVWVTSGMYEKSWAGLMNSYIMGLPFLKNTLIGDLFYVGVIFGAYALLLKPGLAGAIPRSIFSFRIAKKHAAK